MPVITSSRRAIAAVIVFAAPFAAPTLGQTIQGLPPVPEPDHAALLKNPDGSWKYTNRLNDTDSPYLLQHAHNPVDWYPWGAEALAAAREQDKPIFLSVGYSTCYWCHVMEREVFSNPAIAAIMNERFINIKVDREQRPDLDQIYMTTTQLLTGRGGWPNSVFLTPELKPFWAATYIGPEDVPGPAGQRGRPGFPTVITALSEAWVNQREAVEASADRLATDIVRILSNQDAGATVAVLSPAIPDGAIEQLALRYDPVNGGFGVAPKFPSDFTYSFLFRVHERTGDERTLDMALNTLRHMAAGGLHDHVGGGFHRYSTDGRWQVPHFEKMLYNQGQLARAYLEAYERTGDELYADVVRGILRYVERRMSDPAGPFYSALDAETDAVEGEYYVWSRDQIESLLDEEQLALFDNVFLLADVPIFPGHKRPDGGVMCMRLPAAELAAKLKTTPAELTASLAPILSALEEARTPRALPRLDDKAIVAWNGMMIDAYALAGRVLEDEAYTARARAAADFILDTMRDDAGRLQRVWRRGRASQDAFLEDYAFLAAGLITIHRTTGDDRYLESAVELVAEANALFWDDSEDGGGGYFFAVQSTDLIARTKSASDMAIPSGNSVMAHTLLDLAELTGDAEYADRARVLLEAFAVQMTRSPSSYVHMVHAVERLMGRKPTAIPMTPILPMDVFEPADDGGGFGRGLADSSARVDVSAEVDRASLAPGEPFVVTVRLDLDEGWHVNANPASAEYLIPTVADVRSDLPVMVTDVKYPAAHEFSLAGEPINVYETGATIRLSCVLGDDAGPGPSTLRVVVGYQACDDQSCLAPAETIVEVAVTIGPRAQAERAGAEWISLFNGKDLTGWTPKFNGHELGVNVDDTFRVEDGVLKVMYDRGATFDGTFGHLFYKKSYSNYVLRLEYRFTGEQASGGPGWAYRNSGVMIHGQPPETMGLDQSFPVSIEVQLLGGDGEHERPTANVCTPGTHVVMDGQLVTRHCTNSTSATFHGDQWVALEIEVRGNELIRHTVNGEVVMEYTRSQLDMNDANAKAWVAAHNEAHPDDPLGPMLRAGTISLQAESHPCEFRRIELRVLDEK